MNEFDSETLFQKKIDNCLYLDIFFRHIPSVFTDSELKPLLLKIIKKKTSIHGLVRQCIYVKNNL